MKVLAAASLACLLAGGCGVFDRAQVAGAEPAPAWAVDPAVPGPNLPPEGRSLFDRVVARDASGYDLPASFDELVRRIERRLGCATPCSHQVAIPLGRSLQRTAAAPDFFASPRVVVAFTGDGDGRLFAKDRLYLGFQPRAGVIEVISYNEAAARFEFQLVKDFRPGATPQVLHADRTLCTSCHQNQGPVFSRQVWDETNANPQVAAALSKAGRGFHRVPVEVPNAIDDATDRANRIGVTQRLWSQACDAQCRRLALGAMAQFHASGRFDRAPLSVALEAGFRKRWPRGLAIPNPDLPNRDPFAFPGGASSTGPSHVPAALEALMPRAPLEVWRADDAALAYRLVTGLAELFTRSDLEAIQARHGGDPARLRKALAGAEFTGQRFDRAAILRAFDADRASHSECCNASSMPAPQLEVAAAAPLPSKAAPFKEPCGVCHGTPEAAPPNFLAGDAGRVDANLAHCAPRLFARLAQWDVPAAARDKVPMPPPSASRAGHPRVQQEPDVAIRPLRNAVAGWLRAETGEEPDLARMLSRGYESLRPCLRPGA